jgi:hypothetical protein
MNKFSIGIAALFLATGAARAQDAPEAGWTPEAYPPEKPLVAELENLLTLMEAAQQAAQVVKPPDMARDDLARALALAADNRVPCGRGLVARLGGPGCWCSATTAAAAGMLR